MDAIKDDETAAAVTTAASVMPPEVREMLDQCDRAGIGLEGVIDILRARLMLSGFEDTARTEAALNAFRSMLEKHR